MREVRSLMGMPIEIEVIGTDTQGVIDRAFDFFAEVDNEFSPYKEGSAVSRIARGELSVPDASAHMQEVIALAREAKATTHGYFDVYRPDGRFDPSGVVKGWAIAKVAEELMEEGAEDYFVNAGGDIASHGKNEEGEEWRVGIENPFNRAEIVKVIVPRGRGVATSGSYIRGAHIYDPHDPRNTLDEVKSITVVAPTVLRADILATAAFAMGREGVAFIESMPECEAYQVDAGMTATMTSGFERFVVSPSA